MEFIQSFVGCLLNIRRWAMFALLAVRIQRRLERTLELDRLEPLGPIKPGSDGQHQQHHQHDYIFIYMATCPWSPGSTPPCRANVLYSQRQVRVSCRSASGPRRNSHCKTSSSWNCSSDETMIAIRMMRRWLFGENEGRIMLPMQHSIETLNQPHSFTFSSRSAKHTTRAF